MVPLLYFKVDNVVVFWNNIASKSTLHKIDLIDLIFLLVDVFHLVALDKFEQGSNPANEFSVLTPEESDVEGEVFVDLPGQVVSLKVRQLIDEV